ncbi:lipopolysaccharide biosynthesis protein [Microvirga brassicacearum]|uniref:Lipopolysaccharide biosynthesis protein n=1 Tax=Microvirga brassicacearum TaxID=2580413 RepID=A0A5N3P610_9HYPH|nr:oligosaccharide flippase family protein [Microvirga brassicacearum]KAB0265168.1 hypothetical protein FEZ63_19665 [Microvirga brassicacearum]
MATSELKNVVRHGRLYGLANLVGRFSGLVLLPVYTHVLDPEQFGLYTSAVLVTDLLSVVLGMGLGRALVRLHVEQGEETGKDAVLGTALATFAAMAVVIALLAYPIAHVSSRLLLGSADTAWLFTWAIWGLIPSTLFNLQLNYIIVTKQSSFYLAISVAKATLFIVFNLWLVVWLGYGVFGIVISTFIASTIVVGTILGRMFATTSMSISKPVLIELLKFGGPLIPTILLDTVMTSLDRYVIGPTQGAAALGQYGLGLKLASLLNMLVTSPFLQIWGVRQLEALQEGQESRELPNVFFQFTLVLMTICVGIGLFSTEIIRLIADDAFLPAATVLPWLAAIQVVAAVRSYAEVGLHFAKRTAPLMSIALVSLIVAAPTYWFAVQAAGIIGVAAACLAVMLFRTGLTVHWANRHSPLIRALPWSSLAFAVALALVALATGWMWGARGSMLQDALVKFATFSVFAAGIGVMLFRNDQAASAELLKPLIRRLRIPRRLQRQT